jgi:hypothetical protein
LHVGLIVLPLRAATARPRLIATGSRPCHQTDTGAHRRTIATTDDGTRYRANHRRNCCTPDHLFLAGISTNLPGSKFPTGGVINHELVENLA